MQSLHVSAPPHEPLPRGGLSGSLPEYTPFAAPSLLDKLNQRLLPMIFCGALMSALDKGNVSYAARTMSADLGFTSKVYGFGAGIFFIGYSLGLIPASIAAVRVGPGRWVACACIAWGTVAASFCMLRTEMQFYIMRAVLGLAECGGATLIYILTIFYSPRNLNVAYALVHLAAPCSQVGGGLLAAAILSLDGLVGVAGWRWLFLLEGLPTIALGLFFWHYLPNTIDDARFLTAEDKVQLKRQLHKEASMSDKSPPPTSLKGHPHQHPHHPHMADMGVLGMEGRVQAEEQVLLHTAGSGGTGKSKGSRENHTSWSDWRLYYMGAVRFLLDCAVSGLTFWLPLLIDAITQNTLSGRTGTITKANGWWALHSGVVLTTIPFGMLAASSYVVAASAKKTGEQRWHTVVPMLTGAACFIMLPAVLQWMGSTAAFFILTIGVSTAFAVHAPLLAWCATFLQGPFASTGLAVIKVMAGLGSFTGPYAIGVIQQSHDLAYTAALQFVSVALVAASCLCLGMV